MVTTRIICGSTHGPWDEYGAHCPVCTPTRAVGVDPRDAEIAALKAEVEKLTEVARLLVGECEEQRECPVCGTDTNVGVCRPSCYVAKMRKVLDDKKGEGYLAQAKTIADEVSKWPDWKKAGFRTQTEPAPNSAPLPKPDPRDAEIAALKAEVGRVEAGRKNMTQLLDDEVRLRTSLQAEIERLKGALWVEVAEQTARALAAGPAALRSVALQARAAGETLLADGALDCAAIVEAAQEAAMKEGT